MLSKNEKLLNKLLSNPKDFTYKELKKLLQSFGFEEDNKGKTSGSRVVFYNSKYGYRIFLHKPHPIEVLKQYQINVVVSCLNEWRLI